MGHSIPAHLDNSNVILIDNSSVILGDYHRGVCLSCLLCACLISWSSKHGYFHLGGVIAVTGLTFFLYSILEQHQGQDINWVRLIQLSSLWAPNLVLVYEVQLPLALLFNKGGCIGALARIFTWLLEFPYEGFHCPLMAFPPLSDLSQVEAYPGPGPCHFVTPYARLGRWFQESLHPLLGVVTGSLTFLSMLQLQSIIRDDLPPKE